MAPGVAEWLTACSNVALSLTALRSSYTLFRDHRAPSVGFLLVGLSAGLCLLHPSSSFLVTLQKEAAWASEVLAPALVSFHFLWLSEDHNTAFVLLCGSCLLLGLSDALSADALTVMTHCLGLSSMSCCLTVCLFAGNAFGALAGVALSLPLLLTQSFAPNSFASLISPAASETLFKWLLKVSVSMGCWASTHAFHRFLLDVNDRCHISL